MNIIKKQLTYYKFGKYIVNNFEHFPTFKFRRKDGSILLGKKIENVPTQIGVVHTLQFLDEIKQNYEGISVYKE